jgi:hypothetical protein
VSLDVFFLGKSDIYPNTHEPSLAVLREAQNKRSAEGSAFLGETKKHKKRGVAVTKDETPT